MDSQRVPVGVGGSEKAMSRKEGWKRKTAWFAGDRGGGGGAKQKLLIF